VRASLPAPETASSRAGGECEIAAPKARLAVAVRAEPQAFVVTVEGARVTVIPRDTELSSVRVTGAFEFEGTARGLEFFPAVPVVVAHEMVQLSPMSQLRGAFPQGDMLAAQSVDIGVGFHISEVSLPCSALSFVGSGAASEDARRGISAPRLRSFACPPPCSHYTTPETLDFYPTPGGASRIRLSGSTIVAERERRGEWTRVTTEDHVHVDGAQLAGWVEHALLTELVGGVGHTGGRAVAASTPSNAGCSVAVRAGSYQAAATFDNGTAVFAGEIGGAPWATIRDGAAEFAVVIPPDGDRVQVVRAPFLPCLRNAWGARAAMHTNARP
jgi:hypothetical protein